MIKIEFLPNKNGIDIRLLENIFSSMTNSYKIYWFNSVFEEIIKGKRVISFKEATVGMIVSAWYPIMVYKLNFGKQDKLQEIILKINIEHVKNKSIGKDDLYKCLIESEDANLNNLIGYFYKYVPYRLLTTFYELELRGLKDGDKNKKIEELSKNDINGLYKISSEKKELYINDKWFEYIYENQNIIRGWIKYNLLDFIQGKNPNTPAIIYKLTPPIERNLSMATKYWKEIIENSNLTDIYTGEDFNNSNYKNLGNVSIDHFMPWSFIGHDKLWNLVPTFKNVNSSKSDNLPSLEKYFDSFKDMQFKGVDFMRKRKNGTKYLEDYLDVNKELDLKGIFSIKGVINREKFYRDMDNTMKPIYQIAYNQGYGEWEYINKALGHKEIIRLEACIYK